MQDNLAKELAVQHELTIDALEKELLEQMRSIGKLRTGSLSSKKRNYAQI